jgi:hypothetical protein
MSVRAWLVHGFDHAVVAMTQTIHRPALDEVEVSLLVVVVEPGTLAVREHDLRTVRDEHQRFDGVLLEIHDGGLHENSK